MNIKILILIVSIKTKLIIKVNIIYIKEIKSIIQSNLFILKKKIYQIL